MNLTTQAAQVDCFLNAAAHLEPGGRFVVEVNVPQLRRLPPGDRANVIAVNDDYWGISEFDVVEQKLVSHHFTATEQGIRYRTIQFRYVWPSELDLMARLAGMTLAERWGGWRRERFTSDSTHHVSVWRRADDE